MDRTRTPVLVGVGQVTNRIQNVKTDARPTHELIVEAVHAAVADTGGAAVLQAVDRLHANYCIGWYYPDLGQFIADALGITPPHVLTSPVGGNSPQKMTNQAARAIAAGELELAVLCGGEAVASRRKAHRAGYKLPWQRWDAPETRSKELLEGTDEYEFKLGLFMPASTFPLFENALRAQAGETIDAHQVKVSELCAEFSAVAAQHPYAWQQQARTAEEIRTVTETNRVIGFPYPKYMNAMPEVDMGAALIVCSAAKAEALGIAEDRWVYLLGTGDQTDSAALGDRVNFTSSPAARAAGAQAFAEAGVDGDALTHVDLYSCFPCVPQIGAQELQVAGRPWGSLTLTGGLPYFGGPWNNYSMHAIATMVERLREDPDAHGLVYAIGMWLTKQSVGIYSGRPHPDGFTPRDAAPYTAQMMAEPRPIFALQPEGPVTVETYSIAHARSGEPETGFVFARLADDRRCLALVTDRAMLEWMETHEAVGARGRVWLTKDDRPEFALTEG